MFHSRSGGKFHGREFLARKISACDLPGLARRGYNSIARPGVRPKRSGFAGWARDTRAGGAGREMARREAA